MESNDKSDKQGGDASGQGNVDDVKAKMRAALDKKKAQHHASAAGGGQAQGSNAASAGHQRRMFRRKSG